jgi:hypothetical protein
MNGWIKVYALIQEHEPENLKTRGHGASAEGAGSAHEQ